MVFRRDTVRVPGRGVRCRGGFFTLSESDVSVPYAEITSDPSNEARKRFWQRRQTILSQEMTKRSLGTTRTNLKSVKFTTNCVPFIQRRRNGMRGLWPGHRRTAHRSRVRIIGARWRGTRTNGRWYDDESVGDGYQKGHFMALKDIIGDLINKGVFAPSTAKQYLNESWPSGSETNWIY